MCRHRTQHKTSLSRIRTMADELDDDGWGRSTQPSIPSISIDDGNDDGWGRREPHSETDDPMVIEQNSPSSSSSSPETEMPYQSRGIDHVLPGMDGVPINELNQHFVNRGLSDGQLKIVKERYYTVLDNGGPQHDMLYTAIFTCPMTGEHFPCGELQKLQPVSVDGDYWYKRKQHALTAAAAKTLDILSVRRCRESGQRPSRRCDDEVTDNPTVLPTLPPNVVLPGKLESIESPGLVAVPPKRRLVEFYQNFQRKLKLLGGELTMDDPDRSCYASWHNLLQNDDKRFTAVYTCPLTGERFSSGMLGANYVKDHMYYDSERKELVSRYKFNEDQMDMDRFHKLDLIWFRTKKEAEEAAAARAYDCFCYRFPSAESRDAILENRYCKEEPYHKDVSPDVWREVAASVNSVLQFEPNKDQFEFNQVQWATLPESSEIAEEMLRSVLNEDRDEFVESYKTTRRGSMTEEQ